MLALASHQPSGEVYALVIENTTVTAVCGPLHHDEQDGDLEDYNYESEDAEWAESQKWTIIRAQGSFAPA